MPDTDPLALRHGAFIATIWSQIGEARTLAGLGPSPDQSATQLRRIRHLQRQVRKAHKLEMARQDYATPTVDGWFQPVEQCLDRAEQYFSARILTANLPPPQQGQTAIHAP